MNKYKITINGNLYEVEINSLTDTQADVCVNGKPYGVGIEKEGMRNVSGKAPAPKQTVMQAEQPRPVEETISAGELAIKSPLPGTILSIAVTNGQSVKRGEKLLVLEAMKMENDILAEKDGTVAKVLVDRGATVQEGQTLIVLE